MTIERYNERAKPRLAALDRLAPLCNWAADYPITMEQMGARVRYMVLADRQAADEIAVGA